MALYTLQYSISFLLYCYGTIYTTVQFLIPPLLLWYYIHYSTVSHSSSTAMALYTLQYSFSFLLYCYGTIYTRVQYLTPTLLLWHYIILMGTPKQHYSWSHRSVIKHVVCEYYLRAAVDMFKSAALGHK